MNTTFLTDTDLSVGDRVTLAIDGRLVTTRIVGQVFAPNLPFILTSSTTIGPAAQSSAQYDVAFRRGVSAGAYARQLSHALGPAFSVSLTSQGPGVSSFVDTSLIRLLTLMIAVLAAIGVINSLLMATRERVHDLGVFKALGMTPRQTITMVVCWVVVPAVGAAIIGVPFALILHAVTLSAIGSAAGTGMPANVTDIYGTGELGLLSLAALAIAAAGALLPASWAAASRTTAALHAE